MSVLRPLILIVLLAIAPLMFAQNEPPVEPPVPVEPEPAFVLRELLVIQADRYDTTANNPRLIETTLSAPIKHRGRKKRTTVDGAYDYVPMPLGIITFEGEPAEPMKLRLTLQSGRDQFHAHWPGNAFISKQFIEWRNLVAADDTARAISFAKDQDWLDPVRSSEDRMSFQTQGAPTSERLLLYDPSFKFKPALKLDFQDDQYSLSSDAPEQAAPPITVMLRKADAGWSADEVASPWTQPSVPIAKKGDPSTTGVPLNKALKPISALLEQRGYNANEIDLALGMIASAGLDKSGMSLVYVLPVGVIDEHIRLQVKPQPDVMHRTAIVVVNNVDPDLGSQVNALLDDLGSDKWIVRDRAQKQLTTLSQAAIQKVQQLKDNKDPEVAFRAQQILDAYDWKMQGDK